MTVGQLINSEHKEIGYVEGPRNDNKYGAYYGMNYQPWCCFFQEWNFATNGAQELLKITGSCGALYNWAKSQGLVVKTPLPGDLVEFSFGGVEHAHIECVIGEDQTGKYLYCVGGNTSSGVKGSQANGDGVYFRKRSKKQVFCYIRTQYVTEAVKQIYTTREVTIWTAPAKQDDCRLKKVPEGYAVQVYDTPIQSFSNEGDIFYRTIKNRYILAKYC